ncbi:hypothetical protein D3C78_1297290 [compost metagenome]
MRRVGDDDVSLRHIFHHATARGGALHLTDTSFNMRIAFHLFIFVAQILAGHTQFFDMAVDLEEHIKSNHRDDTEHHQHCTETH